MTAVDICNLALGRLGESAIISLEDPNEQARACARFYASTRDQALRDHLWSFAKRRAVLSEILPPPTFGWGHHYQLPIDCLRVFALNREAEDLSTGDPPHTIEGRRLLTDESGARIVYVARTIDTGQYDATFVEVLALLLASKLTTILTGSRDTDQKFLNMYRMAMGTARRQDANEGRKDSALPADSRFVAARWRGV